MNRVSRTKEHHNLPHALTSFVGREHEVAEVARLLATTRLVTLTGAGGIGKTRLGREVAAGQLDAFADGVWIVELAALTDARLVPQAVASVLGIREKPDRPLMTSLVDKLRGQQLLLVLDNCEHLIDASARLAETLLLACPNLRIVATSRQALGIPGETVIRVPTLAVQAQADASGTTARDSDDASRSVASVQIAADQTGTPGPSEAARLFVERAQDVKPAFALTAQNVAAVEQIGRCLDGIPLAIELAAARIRVLSLEQIAARLSNRFTLLTGGSRTALPRHRTLQATMDWSHELLDEREQVLLRRLAVFAGGWTLEAAESVCAADGLASDEILDLLADLVSKSLVQTGESLQDIRYCFLESLRAYAAEKLEDAGEEAELRSRHFDWFLALAERAEPELVGAHPEAWLDRLDRERENMRAAQRWAVAQGDAEMVARLAAALWRFLWARADASDVREWIEAIVPLARRASPTPALARALHGAGALAGTLGDFAICRSLFEDGLAVARQHEDRHTLAALLDSLGRQTFVEGRHRDARPLLDEGAAILREIEDRQGLARALSHLGFLDYLEGRQESARATYREGLDLAREVGEPDAIAEFLDNLGRTYQADGDLGGALHAYEEAEAIWREICQGHRLAMVLNNLGSVQTLRGERGAARAYLAEALRLSQRIGNRRRLAFTLESAAVLAAVEGQSERALFLHAVASSTVVEMGASLVQPIFALGLPYLEQARQDLGATAAEAAVTTGQSTTLAQAVEETLTWLTEPGASASVGAGAARRDSSAAATETSGTTAILAPTRNVGMSPRELEVAALIAQGMTNRQIAEALVISPHTAERHVEHILAKLGCSSRAEIAAWMVRHGHAAEQP